MSPEPATGFGSARLTVVTDGRVRDTQERARVAGYAAGFASGSRAAAETTRGLHEQLRHQARLDQERRDAEHRAAMLALHRASEAALARVLPVLDDARDLVYSRALELARVVVGHELSQAPDSARSALARATQVPHDVRVQVVRLHPGDLAALSLADREQALASGIELVADPTLLPGDAVSAFEGGFVDARVDAAFDRARAAMESSPALMPSLAGEPG